MRVPDSADKKDSDNEPAIYLVVKGYGRGLRVFKGPTAGGPST